jgi:hypothetical protein
VHRRDHPLMSYRGRANWPPTWVKSGGLRNLAIPTLRGEIGTLAQVMLSGILPNRCHLLIDYGDESYMGTLIFDDAAFCRQINDLLQQNRGKSIRQIGNLDLSDTL